MTEERTQLGRHNVEIIEYPDNPGKEPVIEIGGIQVSTTKHDIPHLKDLQ